MSSFVRSFRVSLVVVALGLAAAPGRATAQSLVEPNTVTVTPFLSSVFGTSADLGGSLGIGVAVTYDVTTRLGFEGEFGHAFDLLGDNANVDLGVTNVSANGVYNFPLPRVTPYATFGLGVERSGVHVKTPDPAALYPPTSTEVSYNFGGGVKYPVSERFIVRGDVRRFQATDLAPDYWRVYGGVSWWIKR
jgi:opacity protein-like surface antigen